MPWAWIASRRPQASLLAIARLRKLLSDAALLLLADAEQAALDLRGCGQLGEQAITAALERMPDLRRCDLRGCAAGPATLRTLGRSCPRLELLRLGGGAVDTAAGMSAALKAVLPALEKPAAEAAADSWEEAAGSWDDAAGPGGSSGSGATALVVPGRLMQLRCLHWPGVPWALEQHMAASCPAVLLNPPAEQAAAASLPPDAPLDAAALDAAACYERWRDEGSSGVRRQPQREPVPHIADRFMNAYISQERRLRRVRERQAEVEWKRRERAKTSAERAAEAWESAL